MVIVITTGGTAGHIFPALRVGKELKDRGHKVVFAGTFKGFVTRIKAEGFEVEQLALNGLNRQSRLRNIGVLLRMILGWVKALRRLVQLKADRVVGFGGYASVPFALAAVALRKPLVIHEQNVLPGKANRLLQRYARVAAVSFEATRAYLTKCPTEMTGYPLDTRRVKPAPEVYRRYGLNPEKTTVLVFGGSQGSRKINKDMARAVPMFEKYAFLQFVHLAADKDHEMLKAAYQDLGFTHHVAAFCDEMAELYALADVAVCRAGAGTAAELAFHAVPAVLIPYPAADGHQAKNADVLVQTKIYEMIEEKSLSPRLLRDTIMLLLARRWSAEDKAERLAGLVHERAAENMADLIVRAGQDAQRKTQV